MHKRRHYTLNKIVTGTIVTTMILKLSLINALASEEASQNPCKEIANTIDNKSKDTKVDKSTHAIVNIPDINLKKGINKELDQYEDAPITKCQLKSLKSLNLGHLSIENLEGIQYCTNLICLDLSENKISDINQLQYLTKLSKLNLNNNFIRNLSPLNGLKHICKLSAINQKIVLDIIKVDKTPIKIKNPIINMDTTVLDISNNDISSEGFYDSSTNTIQWNSVYGDLKYSFAYSTSISSCKIHKSSRFNGTVVQPYEYVNNQVNSLPVINTEDKVIKVGYKFNPLHGVTAHDKEDGNITKDIKVIENTVDTNKVGKYTVTYQVTDSKGAIANKTISVIVKSNDKPVIIGADDISITEGYSFNPLKDVIAMDTEDGNLTKDIKVIGNFNTNQPGRYELIYTVKDSDRNTTTVKRTVIVNPKSLEINSIPVINAPDKAINVGDKFDSLDGVSAYDINSKEFLINAIPEIKAVDKVINVGDKFDALAEVTAIDKEDGDITKNIKVVENTVDVDKPGTYKVTYQVIDSQGSNNTKTISISIVKSIESPPKSSSDIDMKNIINPPTGDMSIISYIILGVTSLFGLFIIKKKIK